MVKRGSSGGRVGNALGRLPLLTTAAVTGATGKTTRAAASDVLASFPASGPGTRRVCEGDMGASDTSSRVGFVDDAGASAGGVVTVFASMIGQGRPARRFSRSGRIRDLG